MKLFGSSLVGSPGDNLLARSCYIVLTVSCVYKETEVFNLLRGVDLLKQSSRVKRSLALVSSPPKRKRRELEGEIKRKRDCNMRLRNCGRSLYLVMGRLRCLRENNFVRDALA
jgi:hypothetical protein